MLLVVYSGDLMVLLVGWEIMGICSYFLVGHYWETPEARAASLKAFLVTKLGDVPFLIGLFALAADTGTFRITGILGAVANGGLDHPTLIAVLLLAGVAGKSAQFPLHTWLPDAMAAPPPSPRSSTPRRWSPPESTSWPGSSPSSPSPAPPSSYSPSWRRSR